MSAAKRRRKRKDTEKWLWDEFTKLKENGKKLGPAAFAEHVGIHRTYLYDFPSLVAAIWDFCESSQTSGSKRRRGATAAEAKKQEIDAKVRREHTQWSVEVEELRSRLGEAEIKIVTLTEEKRVLSEKFDRFKRVYEYVLMLAVEAGVSPSELEKIQEKLMAAEDTDLSTLKKA